MTQIDTDLAYHEAQYEQQHLASSVLDGTHTVGFSYDMMEDVWHELQFIEYERRGIINVAGKIVSEASAYAKSMLDIWYDDIDTDRTVAPYRDDMAHTLQMQYAQGV